MGARTRTGLALPIRLESTRSAAEDHRPRAPQRPLRRAAWRRRGSQTSMPSATPTDHAGRSPGAGLTGHARRPSSRSATTVRHRAPPAWPTRPGSPAEDLARNARAIAARHPEVFAPGRILLNRFPFMAAPAHLIQLIAQQGGGVAIPAGNINWDVPFRVLSSWRSEPARACSPGFPSSPSCSLSWPGRAVSIPPRTRPRHLLPRRRAAPAGLQRRIERVWGARVIELYGSTETMLLGTACPERTLHLETDLVYCEILRLGQRRSRPLDRRDGAADRHDPGHRGQPPGAPRHRRHRAAAACLCLW